MINVVTGKTWMNKIEDKAFNLIEEMTLINYEWSSERTPSKKAGGKFDVDALTLLTIKMDAMTRRLGHLNLILVSVCAPSRPCDSHGSFGHMTLNC